MKINISIVIPCFNEEANISNLINEIDNYLKPYIHEIIIVNDCSIDNTKKIIISKIHSNKRLKLINNHTRLGQSYSILEGIINSKYENILTMDGDGQNNPRDIPLLVDKYFVSKNCFLVSGIRIARKDTLIKIISSKIANYIRQKILNDGCVDTGCSLKIFDKKIFLFFPPFDGIHRFIPALFKGYGSEIIYIPVDHRPRLHGNSNYGTFGRLFRGIRDLIKVVKIIKKIKNNRA